MNERIYPRRRLLIEEAQMLRDDADEAVARCETCREQIVGKMIDAGRRMRSTIDGTLRDLNEFERAAARDWDRMFEEAKRDGLIPEGE